LPGLFSIRFGQAARNPADRAPSAPYVELLAILPPARRPVTGDPVIPGHTPKRMAFTVFDLHAMHSTCPLDADP
jgi:hypothetical protein